mmetsp:Transcript_9613/g.28946  ORF Transcript_9613/g.28946 Transcript_9613/m.28946 type:complete len:238 (+) Transcript_9613:627-1340(+)
MPSGSEAGEHALGWAARSPVENLRFWVFQVSGVRLSAQVHGRDPSIHCAGGAIKKTLRWRNCRCLVMWGHALRHASGRIPLRGPVRSSQFPQDYSADHGREVQFPSKLAALGRLPGSHAPDLRGIPRQPSVPERPQVPPLVPDQPPRRAEGRRHGGAESHDAQPPERGGRAGRGAPRTAQVLSGWPQAAPRRVQRGGRVYGPRSGRSSANCHQITPVQQVLMCLAVGTKWQKMAYST